MNEFLLGVKRHLPMINYILIYLKKKKKIGGINVFASNNTTFLFLFSWNFISFARKIKKKEIPPFILLHV